MSSNERLSSIIEIEYPDFAKLPERVKQRYESLPTIVNFFRMMGYSPGTFVEVMDLTDAIFKKLTLSDYHKELLVLQVATHGGCVYEWEQHVSISQATGVREDQFIAIAEQRIDDGEAFLEREPVLCVLESLYSNKAKFRAYSNTGLNTSREKSSDAMLSLLIQNVIIFHPNL